jgi:hypothetical protein
MPHRMFPQLSLGRDRIALKSYCVSHCQRAMINAIQANMKLLKTSSAVFARYRNASRAAAHTVKNKMLGIGRFIF